MASRVLRVLGSLSGALLAGVLAGTLALRGGRDPGESNEPGVAPTEDLEAGAPPPAPVARIEARAPEASSSAPSPEDGPAQAPRDSPWHLPKRKLEVTVLDPWKRPVRTAVVRAFIADGSMRRVGYGSGGGERVALFAPRDVALRLEVSSIPQFHDGVEEPILPETSQVTIGLRLKGARVSGRIVEAESGKPLPKAGLGYVREVVSESLMDFLVVKEGTFDAIVPSGSVLFVAGAPGREGVERREELREGEWRDGLEIALVRGSRCSLSGRVTDEDGRPVAGARVDLRPEAWTHRGLSFSWALGSSEPVLADAGGKFRIEEIDVGENRILVAAAGFESAGPDRVVLGVGENEATIVLARAGRLRVRGILPDGSSLTAGQILLNRAGNFVGCATIHKPALQSSNFSGSSVGGRIEGIRVRERKEWPQNEGRSLSPPDEQGFHTLEGVAWGEYEVVVLAGPLEGRATVSVPPGESARVEVTLSPKR